MQITKTIELAVQVLGSQRAVALAIGEPEQNVSGFKKGRPCGGTMLSNTALARLLGRGMGRGTRLNNTALARLLGQVWTR